MSLFDTKMTELADAIKAKNSNAAAKLSIDGMIAAVNKIEQIQFGYINADGQFQAVDLSGDVPADSGEPIVVDAVSFNTGKEFPEYGCVDTSDATATAEQILNGATAYVNGEKITGNIKSVAAKTYTPGTENQTIAAGGYLAGEQTIKGDANLVSENIADGVTLFGVAGSLKAGGGSMELYRCASVEQPKVPVGFFVAHSKVTATDPEGYVENLYLSDIEYVEYNNGATGSARLWIDKNDIKYINDDWPELDVLGWDGNRWIMCIIYSITDTPSEANGVANSNCTNPNATMAEIAAATWDWNPMGGDDFSDKVTVLEEWGVATGWSGYKCTYDAESGELTQAATLTTGLTCDGFTPRIGKIYSIDSKLQTSLFSDPAGAGFYQCSEGASVPSTIVISGAGTANANGVYVRKPISFNADSTNNMLACWYKSGDTPCIIRIYNDNSNRVRMLSGYLTDDDKFYANSVLYSASRQVKTIEEGLQLIAEGKWSRSSGADPVPTGVHTPASGTWKGYKLSQNSDGTWSKADTETDGLKVGAEEPLSGIIYNEDATVTISSAMGLE